MEKGLGQNDPKLTTYTVNTFQPEDSVLREIRERAVKRGVPEIQVGKMDGLHLEVLARAIGARKIVEIGTLAGYSGVCLARALPENGRLYTFEYSPLHAEVAQESFEKAGVAHKVKIFQGDARAELEKIRAEGPFDLMFIDADKVSYPDYLTWAEENLRVGGMILGDNTFAWGTVGDTEFENQEDREAAEALHRFNQRIAQGGRFRATMIPTHEGLTCGVKIR